LEINSEIIPTIKLWNHAIETKKGFVPRKGKMYLLLREEREEVHKFISEKLRKEYIRLLKSSETTLVFFCRKEEWYRTINI